MADDSKIKLLRECLNEDVKPLLDDEVYEGLMDLLHLAIIEAYEKGRRAKDGRE
jgi:predicted house-cleaning noncanonical NTP pyrophosphatase (MazG superfamily)